MKPNKKVSVTEFKAHALQLIESVRTTKQEIEIYKRGKRVAKLVPADEEKKKSWIGQMDGIVKTCDNPDDILEPLDIDWGDLFK